jgi:2-methylisocitrate lyase-like PEP mutase family enzyme
VAPKPVNVLIGPRSGPVSVADLAAAGVRRISLGGALYRVAMGGFDAALKALAGGDLSVATTALPSKAFTAYFPG